MKRLLHRVFGSPEYPRMLCFAAKYAAVLQVLAAMFFFGASYGEGELGYLNACRALLDAAWVTTFLGLCIDLLLFAFRKRGYRI